MKEGIFGYMQRYEYEELVMFQHKPTGLKAVVAIHDTTLGPAGGGLRMWEYDREEDAIEDALRLARGMTYKYAAAGVNLGGGKAVIIGNPKTEKNEALLRAFGRFLNTLNGRYYTGEDVGLTLDDMAYIRMETPYVITLPEHLGGAGNVSVMTAFGVTQGMKVCLKRVCGDESLTGRTVALQGLGSVGYPLAERLVNEGARVIAADIDEEKVRKAVEDLGVQAVTSDAIYSVDCDVFSPCALGGIINRGTISLLKCKIVAGSANNQLGDEQDGEAIAERGIVYAPDYVINSGGAVYDADRIQPGGMKKDRAVAKVASIYQRIEEVLDIAEREGISTSRAADVMAERRIQAMRQIKLISTPTIVG